MKKLIKSLAVVAVFGVLLYTSGALAQDVGTTIAQRLASVFDQVRTVFYVLAAFGIIGLAVGALLGKIAWKWLWALVFGVAIVAAASWIVSFGVTGGQGTSATNVNITAPQW